MSSRMSSVYPRMALSGVRNSWLMLARNCDLCWLASASCRLLSSISWNRRAFWIASTDWAAKVCIRELSRRFPAHHQSTDNTFGAEQWNNQNSTVAGPQDHLQVLRWRLILQVGDLQRCTLARRLADTSISDADVSLLKCRD